MDLTEKTVGKVTLGAPPGAEGWKDVLQLLREQIEKMEKLSRALSVNQQGMLRDNPRHLKGTVNVTIDVLSGMLNTHKCLLESGVEIQKRLESHPASKKVGIFRRPRSASLGDTPKKLTKGEKRAALSPPEDRLHKKGKGGTSPTYAAATRGQTPQKDGEWQLVERQKKKKDDGRVVSRILSCNQLPAKCKAEWRFPGRCIGSREGVFWL